MTDTWDTADRIARELAAAGFTVSQDASRISKSAYVEVTIDEAIVAKIRVSDHILPVGYAAPSFDVGSHQDADDWTYPIVTLCARFDRPLPSITKGVLTRAAGRRAADRARDAADKAAFEEANADKLARYASDKERLEQEMIARGWGDLTGKKRKAKMARIREQLALVSAATGW